MSALQTPSPLSSDANARRRTGRHVTEVHLLVWAGTLLASSHPGASASYLPGWCLAGRIRGEGRSHIKRVPPCCTSALGLPDRAAEHPHAQLQIFQSLWPFHHPRHATPSKPGNCFSFTFRRVERTWPIFIAANQASSAPAALRKIAEAFLSLRLFIIHQIGFHLSPSNLCGFFS